MDAEAASSLRELNGLPHILFVDHNLGNQRAVMGLLKESGYCVEMVANGQDALAALEDRRFDIVLMDIQPPEIDGAKTITVIRDREKEKVTGAHLPIIAVTSHALEQEREGRLQAGMDACVLRPVKLAELLRTIERLTKAALKDSGYQVRPGQQTLKQEDVFATMADRASLAPGDDYALTQSLKLLAEIQTAIRAGDVSAIRHTADALKGSITSVLAKKAFEAASTLEKTVHEVDLARAKDACRCLRAAIASLKRTGEQKAS
jgi:two-component system, sensor histidine kinase and response regulator